MLVSLNGIPLYRFCCINGWLKGIVAWVIEELAEQNATVLLQIQADMLGYRAVSLAAHTLLVPCPRDCMYTDKMVGWLRC